jgi:O-antigen/teichoic acid export membrane protein
MSETPAALPKRVAGASNLGAGVVYAGSSVLQSLLTLILLPVYTRILTPSEYGYLSVILAVATLARLALSFGLETAIVRAWFTLRDDPAARASWMGSVGLVAGIGPILGAGTVSLLLWVGSSMPLEVPIGWMALGIMGAGIGAAATVMPLSLLRAQERLKTYVGLNVVLAAVNTGATLTFMVVFGWGVAGWLAGTILAFAVCLALALRLVPWPNVSRSTFSGEYVKEALGFGVPLVPHLVSHWALQVADRIVLIGLITAVSLGTYTLASNLTMPILVVAMGFSQSTMPTFAQFSLGSQSIETIRRLVVHLTTITCIIGFAAGLLLPVGINEALPPSYHSAATLCGWLALGFSCAALYQIPMNSISLIAGRTRWVWIITGISAGIDIALLYLWVPTGGTRAAAIANAVAYAFLLFGVAAYSVRLVGSDIYPSVRLVGICGVAVVLFLAASLAIPDYGAIATGLRVAWTLAGCFILASVGGFNPARQLGRIKNGRLIRHVG